MPKVQISVMTANQLRAAEQNISKGQKLLEQARDAEGDTEIGKHIEWMTDEIFEVLGALEMLLNETGFEL